jgi:translation initiation factor eIF-2B subunit epsilon
LAKIALLVKKRVDIGSNVILDGAYIFDNVTIKDDCIISKSVVGAHSIILENTTLDSGCIIDYHVTLGPNVTIPQRTLVSSSEQERFGDDLNSNADVKSILGAESIGFLYVREDEEEMTSKIVLHSLIGIIVID